MNCKLHPFPSYPKFDVVAGIALSDFPERYIDGSVSIGRDFHAN
jgi:hypothetical protein